MKLGGKWIEGIRPEESVADAATLSLSARLAAVGHWLPLAASHATQDIEYVHQLRVSTRRAGAALDLYRDWQATRTRRWIKKRLKRIRRAAGTARDLDVLGARLRFELGADESSELLAQIAKQRAAAQPSIVRVAERMRHQERFARKVHRLLDGIETPDAVLPDAILEEREQPLSFRNWARQQLSSVAREFFAATPPDLGDLIALHDFRIHGKQLRYAIELLAPAFERALRREHYPVIEALQERLGKINDHVVGAERLRAWSEEVASDHLRKSLRTLADKDRAQIDGEIDSFRNWWSAERMESLRRAFLA